LTSATVVKTVETAVEIWTWRCSTGAAKTELTESAARAVVKNCILTGCLKIDKKLKSLWIMIKE